MFLARQRVTIRTTVTGRGAEGFVSDFEADLSRWVGIDGTISQITANRPGSAGTKSMRLTDTGSINNPCAWRFDTSTVPGHWYKHDAWVCRGTGAGGNINIRDNPTHNTTLAPSVVGTQVAGTWKNLTETFRAASFAVVGHFEMTTTAQNQYVDIDDASLTPLPLSTLISNVTTATSTVTAQVRVTHPADSSTQKVCGSAGVIVNIDSATNPQNCVLAHLGEDDSGNLGTRVLLEKCVNGIWTTLATTTVTYEAGAMIQLIRSGNVYSAYYNGLPAGSATISDASIISNTSHGSFNTDSRITLANFGVADGQGTVIFDKLTAADGDDGRWREGNSVFQTTGGLPAGYDDGTTKVSNAFQRFLAVNVPKNATVTAAYLQLVSVEANDRTTVNINICAVLAANPAAPTTYAEAEEATRTAAIVPWANVGAWTDKGAYNTVDISTVIQELVDQETWVSGNAVVIYVEDNGSTTSNYSERIWYGYAAGYSSPNLHIEFTIP